MASWFHRLRAARPTGPRKPSTPLPGLLFVGTNRSYSMFYLTDSDEHPEGWAGLDTQTGSDGAALLALDYKTGKPVWKHEWPNGGGPSHMLSTDGKLLFTANGTNLIAFAPATGKILWHTESDRAVNGGPDHLHPGRQAVPDTRFVGYLYSFTINEPVK